MVRIKKAILLITIIYTIVLMIATTLSVMMKKTYNSNVDNNSISEFSNV